jgi:succinoglycan biosynthesis transport protein ExoP
LKFDDALRLLRAGRWLLLAGLLAGLLVAAVLSYSTVRTYVSSTQLFVTAADATDAPSAYQGELFSQSRVDSYARLVTGSQLAQEVVDELQLPLSAREVAAKVTATPLPETVVLDVMVTDTSAQRAQDIARVLGEHFATRVTELETPDGATDSPVRVITVQPADLNPTPVSPQITSDLARGAGIGLLLGLLLALLRGRLDRTVRTGDDVRTATGLELIGSVFDTTRRRKQPTTMLVPEDQSPTAESYRTIRLALRHASRHSAPGVIVVTSALAGEGKSTVATNLAVSLARTGSLVTLVDGNLRRPRVARYLSLDEDAPGLTDVLAGRAEAQEGIQRWGDGNLSVLAAGPMPPDPAEVLGSAEMRALLDTLRATEDVVVIDAPPLLPVVDAAILSSHADGCLVVAAFGRTKREQLTEAASRLARVDATPLGVVLTRVPLAPTGSPPGASVYPTDPDRRRAARSNGDAEDAKPTPAGQRTAETPGHGQLAALVPGPAPEDGEPPLEDGEPPLEDREPPLEDRAPARGDHRTAATAEPGLAVSNPRQPSEW